MSIVESVYSRLQGLGSVYLSQAPQSSDPPYLVFQVIGGREEMTLQGSTDLVNTRVQVDAYAVTPTAARSLARQARDLMKTTSADFACGDINALGDFPEPDLNTHRVSADFSLWHDIG